MQSKLTSTLIYILLISIAFIVALFQRQRIKDLKQDNKAYQSQLQNITKSNEINLSDLQKRNEELKNNEIIYKEQKDILQAEIDKISKVNSNDCINSPININIIKLLQKAGI